MERAARHRVSAAGGTPQLDSVVAQSARREEREADRRRAETGGLDHRLGLRFTEGVHHPHRAHGRPRHGRARSAPGAARRARGVTYRVAVADKVAEAGLKLLAQTPEIEVTNCAGKPREELERALAGAHALIVRSETRVTADLLTRGPNLRVIARAGTGVDNIDVHAATRRGIAVMNAPGANTVSAAEHAMGLLLAQARHIPWAAEAMRRGEWDRKRFEGTELRGKTIGIVGLGRIGGQLAKLERVILTPHLAASTAEAQERVSLEICGAVRDALLAGDLSPAINVPGISGDLLRRLGPLLDLARRLGRLALVLVDGPVTAVEVDYGGKDEAAPRPVLMAAVEGLLSAMNGDPVRLGNALLIVEEGGV